MDVPLASHAPPLQLTVRGGWALIAAALSGVVAAVFPAFMSAAVSDDRFSYPFTPEGFTAMQVFLGVHHLALVVGLYAVLRSGFAGTGRLATIGGVSAVAAMLLLALQELVAISGADSAYPSDRTDLIEMLYGVISMVNGVALILFGIAAYRARRWHGWRRVMLLALGIYVFVPLTPAIFGPFVVARLAIGLWMLLFGALGWALLRPHGERPHVG